MYGERDALAEYLRLPDSEIDSNYVYSTIKRFREAAVGNSGDQVVKAIVKANVAKLVGFESIR